MPLGTLDRTPPPFFRQGTPALTKLVLTGALALFLMVADTRLGLSQPIRTAFSVVLYPLQWAILQPVRVLAGGGAYLQSLESAQRETEAARLALTQGAARAQRVEQLELENRQLRELLSLRAAAGAPGRAAQVLYDAPDPFTRRVVIDAGQLAGVTAGSPVIDETGVLGQVTRVYPSVSEVTLLTDRAQTIPVLNTRTGERAVAFGDPFTAGGSLELRFVGTNSDIQQGDLLTTSGVDGVYPPGLRVAIVSQVERRAEASFARIHARPAARLAGARHVLVLGAPGLDWPQRPAEPKASDEPRRRAPARADRPGSAASGSAAEARP